MSPAPRHKVDFKAVDLGSGTTEGFARDVESREVSATVGHNGQKILPEKFSFCGRIRLCRAHTWCEDSNCQDRERETSCRPGREARYMVGLLLLRLPLPALRRGVSELWSRA